MKSQIGGIGALLALLGVVLVPTACVLWFMNIAVASERLAVRQRLIDIFREQLIHKQQETDTDLEARMRQVDDLAALPPLQAYQQAFEKIPEVQSAIILDDKNQPIYPVMSVPTTRQPPPAQWTDAAQAESNNNLPTAASLYAQIAATAAGDWKAEALRAQARCLLHNNQQPEALRLLTEILPADEFRTARDDQGRLLAADTELLAIQLLADDPATKPTRDRLLRDLWARMTDPAAPVMPLPQRQFLRRELQPLWPQIGIDTITVLRWNLADITASLYFDEALTPPTAPGAHSTRQRTLWTLAGNTRRVIALWSGPQFRDNTNPAKDYFALEWTNTTHYPTYVALAPASRYLPELNRAVYLSNTTFAVAARQQEAAYWWTASVGIAAIAVLATALAWYLQRQARVTRLKNDLIATVSHELKTPLSSMRLLVDTLLENRCTSPTQEREYLSLIARENLRLSRLIDNFLTFSRMERHKKTFTFQPTSIPDIARAAVDALAERSSSITVQIPPDLPKVLADPDALTTVLTNLLDNAWKYSTDPRHITLSARAENHHVAIAVADRGIGIAPRHRQRIFERFYQVDQSLARTAGGCGLGLAIVRFIITAHHGSITVESQLNHGSTFTLRLPALAHEAATEIATDRHLLTRRGDVN